MHSDSILEDIEAQSIGCSDDNQSVKRPLAAIVSASILTCHQSDWSLSVVPLRVIKDFVLARIDKRLLLLPLGGQVSFRASTIVRKNHQAIERLPSLNRWLQDLPPVRFQIQTSEKEIFCTVLRHIKGIRSLSAIDEVRSENWLIPLSNVRFIEIFALES